jgi:hypothetical protein
MNPFERALGLAAGMTDAQMMQQDMHRAALQSVQLQAIQTGLLAQMSSTMGSIHAEVAQARQQQAEALAIQQELLARERLQTHLEEFIYQTEKLIAECSKADTDMPTSTRFFLLSGVLGQIENDGIATPIIKGRDNKAAFERVLKEATGLVQRFRKDPEVQQAIAWAKKLEDRRQRKREQVEQKVAPLRAQLESLQEQRRTPVSMRQAATNWIERLKLFVPAQHRTLALVVVLVAATCLFPFVIITAPFQVLGLWLDRSRQTQERNATLDKEIAQVEEKIRALTAGM